MKGKLKKSWILSSIVLMGLTTTLPSVNMVLAETVNGTQNTETQDVTLPYDNLLEAPTSESSDTQQEPTVEEQPTFSLEKEQMVGTIGETTEVVILVDRPTNQVQVTIPQEITIQREELSEELEATQMTETEWWFSADERTKFTIPISSETAGEFTIRVEDELDGTIAFEEAADDEIKDESVVTDETDSSNETENSAIPEVQEEEDVPTEETEEVTPATTSNVSTWAQFRTAINTASVTEINVLADISGNTSLNDINRSLTINGNSLNIESQSLGITGSNRRIVVRNIKIWSTSDELFAIRAAARNTNIFFSDIDASLVTGRFVNLYGTATSVDNNVSITFDAGVNTIAGTFFSSRYLTIKSNTIVKATHGLELRQADSILDATLLVEEGAELSAVYVNNLSRGEINGTLTLNRASSEPIIMASRGDRRINIGSTGRLNVISNSPTGLVRNVLNSLTIERDAEFNFVNSGGPITSLSTGSNVVIDTENLAVWNRGRTSSIPSQNFENLEAQLTGINAATITSTDHNVFRSTYSKQGLNGYSRISSSGLAGETPVDPLEPDAEIDPDNPPVIPENQGNFRLDFVSQFTFGSHERNMFEEETYYALPQYGLDSNGEVIESEPKPNFVQITDNRADADGWQLSVTQREQFKTETGNELSGASLQLKNRQLVADHDGQQPQEATTEETIILEPGAKQPLLTSSTGEGKGTWIYRFGDGTSSDQSVALVVPKETIPEATTYQTKLDWELQAIPGNE